MTLAGTRPPTVDEWEQYELHHRSRMSIKEDMKSILEACRKTGPMDERLVRGTGESSAKNNEA